MTLSTADRRRLAVAGFGAVIAGLVGYAALQFVASITFAVFLYYATRPIYRRIEARSTIHHRVNAALTLILFALPFVALAVYAGALVVAEAQAFAARHGTEGTLGLLGRIAGVQLPDLTLDGLRDAYTNGEIARLAEVVASQLGGVVSFLGNFLVRLGVVFVGAYYMLVDGHRLTEWLYREYDESGALRRYASAVDANLSVILFGNILNAVLTALIGIVVYLLYNVAAPAPAEVPFPALVGALTGIGSLLPVVGIKIVYYPVGAVMALTAYLAGATGALVFVVAFFVLSFVVVDLIPDLVLRPFVSGRNTHMGLLLFAYVFGPFVFGFYGLFLGPILLVLFVNFVRILLPFVLDGEVPPAPGADEEDGLDGEPA